MNECELWGICGVILTGEHWSRRSRKQSCCTATSSTTNPALVLAGTQDFLGKTPASSRLKPRNGVSGCTNVSVCVILITVDLSTLIVANTTWHGTAEWTVSNKLEGTGKEVVVTSGVPRNFVRGGGGSTNSVEDRENGDLGAVPPSQGFWRQL